jgi:endonuclease/exonuclease/phosphatase family metal-dependent hydrolase
MKSLSLKFKFYLTHFIFIVFCTNGCDELGITENISDTAEENFQISKYGSENSFDIATWNMEHFPKDPEYTQKELARIIPDIDIDMIAFQEIDDPDSFEGLANQLEDYNGYVSQLPEYGQKLAILYKSDFISISSPIQFFTDDKWAFPRPPLVTFVQIKKESETVYDFILIVLHLKAFNDEESIARRKDACQKLKKYVDSYLLSGIEKDIVILGDFNDETIDPPEANIFEIFLRDSLNYHILTSSIKYHPTYIGGIRSVIDHIIISKDSKDEYQGGITKVLNIDEEYNDYINTISDHRPVLSQFFIFNAR